MMPSISVALRKFIPAIFVVLFLGIPAHAVEVCPAWLKGYQFNDANGVPLSSGTIRITNEGTDSLLTTYSNRQGTTPNTLDGSNRVPLNSAGKLSESIYVAITNWKFVLKDISGTTIDSEDAIKGCLDTSGFLTGSVTAETPVITKSSDYTILTTDSGKVIAGNPTGGSFTLTMPSAVTAGDGYRITVRHAGTANNVTVQTVSAQTINGSGTSRSFTTNGEVYTFISDGANWHVDGYGVTTADGLALSSGKLTFTPQAPRGYIDGCIISNNSGDATNDIDIAAGIARDSTNAANLTCSALTKRLDANWSAGTGNGCRNSAATIANATYYVYVVGTTSVYDYYCTTSAVAATALAALQAESGGSDYAYARRIGAIVRASNAILPFTQDGKNFVLKTPLNVYSNTNPGTSAVLVSLTPFPQAIRVNALIAGYALFASSNAGIVRVYSTDQTDAAADGINMVARAGAGTDYANFQLPVQSDTSGQIRFRISASTGSDAVQINFYGWQDQRGADNQ